MQSFAGTFGGERDHEPAQVSEEESSVPSRGHEDVRVDRRGENVNCPRVLASSLQPGIPEAHHPRTPQTGPLDPLPTFEFHHRVSASWVCEWYEALPSVDPPPIAYALWGDHPRESSVILPPVS